MLYLNMPTARAMHGIYPMLALRALRLDVDSMSGFNAVTSLRPMGWLPSYEPAGMIDYVGDGHHRRPAATAGALSRRGCGAVMPRPYATNASRSQHPWRLPFWAQVR